MLSASELTSVIFFSQLLHFQAQASPAALPPPLGWLQRLPAGFFGEVRGHLVRGEGEWLAIAWFPDMSMKSSKTTTISLLIHVPFIRLLSFGASGFQKFKGSGIHLQAGGSWDLLCWLLRWLLSGLVAYWP